MKKRHFVNGKSVMAAIGMVAAFSVWGCGNGEGTKVQSVGEMEERAETGDMENEGTGAGVEENAEDRTGDGQDGSKAEGNTGMDADSGRIEDADAGEQVKLNGVIQEVEDGSFVMEQLVSEVDESTGLVLVSGDSESDGVIVDYTEDTVFVRRVTTDGVTAVDEAGTKQDLGKDTLVYVTGIWRGERFLAAEISVFVDKRQ